MIKWKFISPALKVASGTVTLEQFKHSNIMAPAIKTFQWDVTIKNGSFSQRGYIPHLNGIGKDIIESMCHCYFNGVCLDDHSVQWTFAKDILEKFEGQDEDYII